MKNQYQFIVVEDVDLQREHLISLLKKRLDLRLIGSFGNAEEAYSFLSALETPPPDILFLDIEMPEANGFSLLEAIQHRLPELKVIITSAFPQYAVKGYDYNNICAYLLKPLEPDKLNKAIQKAILEMDFMLPVAEDSSSQREHLLIKEKGKWVKILHEEILYCEGANVDVKIITPRQTHLTRERLKKLTEMLPGSDFLRVHDSFIINLNYIKSYTGNYTFVDLCFGPNTELKSLSIGPKYRDDFKRKMKDM